MRYFKDFYKHITRRVTPDWHDIFYYAFQHHLEHVGISLLLTLCLVYPLSIFGSGAPLLASVSVIILFLIAKNRQGNIPLWKKSIRELKDTFTDLNQYMVTFVLSYMLMGEYFLSFLILMLIAIIYVLTYKWTKP